VAWAPHESGCVLAAASTDGNVSVLEFKDNAWSSSMFQAHAIGANAVSWAPSVGAGAVTSATQSNAAALRRFVTGGSDCLVKIWDYSADTQSYSCVAELPGHSDWVRDVAWAPTILSKSYIASASQDKSVKIWTTTSANPGSGQFFWFSLCLQCSTNYVNRRLDPCNTQFRRCRLACQLVPQRQRPRREHW
jgi:protein transport protein SEC13